MIKLCFKLCGFIIFIFFFEGDRYIEVFRVSNFRDKGRGKKSTAQQKNFVSELKEDEEEEDVAESGRLFVRNLSYTCSEEELKEVFTKHGEDDLACDMFIIAGDT